MADEQGSAVAEEAYQYNIQIEDAGPATKKVKVEIPADRIKGKLAEQYKELRSQAAIPGFRVGHAPAKLIEKRFAADVKDQVRRSLISESYEQAVEKNSLNVIGEPQFDNPESIELKDDQSLTYSFEIEVQPDITLPLLTGLKVKKPKIDIKDENIDQAMNNLREQQGALVPVENRGAEEKDFITADVHIKDGDKVVTHQHDAPLVVRPGRVGGINVEDLDKQLTGVKAGETKNITAKAADSHPEESIRGKDVTIEIKVKDIKKLELAEVNEAFLEDLGFKEEKELREALKEQMVQRIEYDVQQSMREQINRYLLENVTIDLPTKLSDRQTDRIVQRRTMDLLMRGLPEDKVADVVEKLREGAKDEAARELKLFFILQKIAQQENVDIDEAELNGRVALLAAQRGQRPEKMKQEMAKDGSLSNLYVQMREQKAVDKILETALVEEVEVKPGEEQPAAQKPE